MSYATKIKFESVKLMKKIIDWLGYWLSPRWLVSAKSNRYIHFHTRES